MLLRRLGSVISSAIAVAEFGSVFLERARAHVAAVLFLRFGSIILSMAFVVVEMSFALAASIASLPRDSLRELGSEIELAASSLACREVAVTGPLSQALKSTTTRSSPIYFIVRFDVRNSDDGSDAQQIGFYSAEGDDG